MAQSELVKKLMIKPGDRILLINAPRDYELGLDLPENAEILLRLRKGEKANVVQLFVKNKEELCALVVRALAVLKENGLLWVCYPHSTAKFKSDLTTKDLCQEMEDHLQVKVDLIEVNSTWAAARFMGKTK